MTRSLLIQSKLSVMIALLTVASTAAERMNVLLMIADDLRTEMGCYGCEAASTPHLDRLAEKGVRFDRAYCQFPLCNPSRSSMLTGLRPTTTGVLGNRSWFGATRPEAVSLPRHFKEKGYQTYRVGKVFHGGIDDTEAWTEGGEARYFGEGATARPPKIGLNRPTQQQQQQSDRWVVLPDDGSRTSEHRVADRAIGLIEDLSRTTEKQPFFLACGFHKPHSPPEAPQSFYDLFRLGEVRLPADYAPSPTVPHGFPRGAIRPMNADLFVGRDSTPESAREMIRAYRASSSWMDHQAGRVLNALARTGLDRSTLIVFWGDHGYQLGEKGKWSKAGSLWEQGLRVPLIVYDPRTQGRDRVCPRVVESLDIYPTLCDLCDLSPPEGLEGRSLAPFLRDPDCPSERPAYSIWSEDGRHVTGVAVRTSRWRYAEFFGRGAGRMLTDPINDPHETVNLADEAAHAGLIRAFSAQARDYAGEFIAASPSGSTP